MRTFKSLMCTAICLFATALGAAPEYNPARARPAAQTQSVTQHVIVKLRTERTSSRRQAPQGSDAVIALTKRTGVTMIATRPIGLGLHVVHVQPAVSGETLARTLARLRADSAVEYAEPDQRRYVHSAPNDPLYSQQWYQQSPSASVPAAVDAVTAWSITTGSNGIVIADLDTGVRFDHPDLLGAGPSGRLLSGYDFISDAFVANDGDGWDPDASDPGDWISQADLSQPECSGASVEPSSWHGTRTAGILGALTNNGVGIAGMTWNAWIEPVRVLGKCGGTDSDIETGMLWAAGIHVDGVPDNPYPAKIENMSLGGTGACPQSYQDVLSQLAALGVLVVASAGNEGGPVDAPANCTGVAGVAGLRQSGTKVGYSSLGPQIALSAPAGNCVNTTAGSPCLYQIETTFNLGTTIPGANDYTDQINNPSLGTSFSAPMVSGIAGLMLAANGNLTSPQLIARLKEGSTAFPQTSVGETTQPPMCHVPANSGDIQNAECICTLDGRTCGAGMANGPGALAAAERPVAADKVPATVVAGGNVTLDASGSGAACNHSIASYQWTSSDPTNHPVSSSNSPTTSVAAPSSGSFTVTLTVTDDGGRTDTASVTVTSTSASTTAPATASASGCLAPLTVVSLTPHGPSVLAGTGTQAFTASVGDTSNTAVTWQVNGIAGGNTTYGTISTAGLYSAPAVIPSPATVMVTAVSAADTTRSAWTQLTITSSAISVSVSPSTASVVTGATQSFSATITGTSNTTVSWQVNGVAGGNTTIGTISASGVYTAPSTVPSPATVTVTAVSTANPAASGTAQVTITAPGASPITVSVSPTSASVPARGGSQAFTAAVSGTSNTAVTWQVGGITGGNSMIGTISSSGLYTAPAAVPSPATVAITAVSAADPAITGTAQVTVTAPEGASSDGGTNGGNGGNGGGSGALDPTTLAVSLLCLVGTLRRQRSGRGIARRKLRQSSHTNRTECAAGIGATHTRPWVT
jgi:serine protease